ncbi:MAG: helicase C-terminal domain-containing protein [Candidatus Helarchaeota archaeon]
MTRFDLIDSFFGGRNSEGVDFPGPEMNAVVIVGLPLPRPTFFLSKLEKYYNSEFGPDKGRDYSSVLPALRRANQAAGRPVRRLVDKGIIIFLDERYNFKYYKRGLSNWIRSNMITLNNYDGELAEAIIKFNEGQSVIKL